MIRGRPRDPWVPWLGVGFDPGGGHLGTPGVLGGAPLGIETWQRQPQEATGRACQAAPPHHTPTRVSLRMAPTAPAGTGRGPAFRIGPADLLTAS